MIKAEDLRIGDIVQTNKDGMFPKDTLCIVTEIHPDRQHEDKKGVVSLKAVNDDDDGPWGAWCCNIDGVPVTPEILEKNGWERDKLVAYIYGHEAHNIEVICTPNSEWMYVNFKGETIHRIKYVHELQRILWALGLDANLKI